MVTWAAVGPELIGTHVVDRYTTAKRHCRKRGPRGMRHEFVIAIGILAAHPWVARATPAAGGVADGPPTENAPAPVPALTSPTSQAGQEAMRLYDEGLRHFRAGAYDDAIVALRAAYERVPLSALLYDLGQAYRLKGDCDQALVAYRHFLATAPVGHERALAEARLADMQRCASTRPAAANSNTGAAPATDAPTPERTASATSAPPHVAAAAPSPLALDARLPHPETAAPPARPRLPALVAAAVAVGLATTSGYCVWSAASASDQVSGAFVPAGTWSDDLRAADRSGRWSDRMAIATGAAALVAAGVAAWLYWR